MEAESSIEKQYDVFIVHASEDKGPFVRSLAKELINKGVSVWYDEFTLKLGDSLRKSIDKGLVNSRYGIVVLSKNFFIKNWPEKELNGLAAREINGQKVILPIWHEITREEVLQYSPTLADKLAISTSEEMTKIVASVIEAIGVPASERVPGGPLLNIQKRNGDTANTKNRNVAWKKIGKFALIISIIAAIVAILNYFEIKPKRGHVTSADKQIARIHFEQSRLFVNRAVWGNDQIPVCFFQIQVFNKSYDSSIRVKHLKLTNLRKLDGGVFKPWENAVPAILKWPVGTSKEISPREDVFVPFARIFPPEIQKVQDTLLSGNIEVPQLRFTVAIWHRQMTSHVPPGTHRFKLSVFFENEPPAEAEFQLEWSGEQRDSLDSMAKDIKIKLIN